MEIVDVHIVEIKELIILNVKNLEIILFLLEEDLIDLIIMILN